MTALLDLFISSNASICSTMAFSSLENSDHVVVSVSIDFQINSKWDALFHCIAYDYSHADRDGLCDHLRYVPLEDIFKLSNSADGGEFCECIQTGIDMYILQCKYQVKSNSSPWFSAACAAAMVHRNQFFCLYQQIKSSESKVHSDRLVIVAKRYLKLPHLRMLLKQKSPSLPRILVLGIFGEFLIAFSTKVNLLYLLNSTALRCCLLHVIKQNCLLKTFLRTIILMTWVSLYLFSVQELI